MNSSTPPEKVIPPSSESKVSSKHPSPWTNIRFLGFLGFFLCFLIPLGIRHGFTVFFFSLFTFLEVVLLFNILIIVHELGHFLAAKWCGLKIEKFAIWMGKPLWSKKVDGVEYILGTIPAGGYVALPQMAPMEALEGKSEIPQDELPPASPGKKIIVAFAGPLFSFGLALFFGCIVWVVGKPVGYSEGTSVVGYVLQKYPAAQAGIRPGDIIESIDGHAVHRFYGNGDSVVWRIMTSTGDTIPIGIKRGDQEMTLDITPARDPEHEHHWWQRSPRRMVGIAPADGAIIIKKLLPDSPALVAGLKPKDQILQMNGQPLYSTQEIYGLLRDHPHDPINFQIVRDGNNMNVTVMPEKPIEPKIVPKDAPETDIGLDELDGEKNVTLVYPNPFVQVRESVDAVTGTISALFARHSNVGASQLSGPIGIMNIFFAVLSSENGWRLALWIAVLINVNLAMLNLLPLPVLDGGHIMLSIIEWIRRKSLSMRILEPLQTTCALLLIGYMVFITFFDIQDSAQMAFGSGGEIKFAPKQVSQ